MNRLLPGLLLTLTAVLTAAGPAAAHTLYTLDEDGVNLRRSPGTGTPILDVLAPGQGVEVLGRQGSWFQVRTARGEEAWAAAWVSRVVFDDEEMEAVLAVDAADVRVRPASDGAVLARVNREQPLPVLEEAAGWYRVRLPDARQGWLDSRLAVLAKKEPPVPAAEPAGRKKQVTLAVATAPVRVGRNPRYEWVDSVKQGEPLQYLGAAEGWVKVETPRGARGWLRGSQVTLRDVDADPARTYRYELDEDTWSISLPGDLRVTTPAEGLRLRQQPGLQAPILAMLPAGTLLRVLGEQDGWLQVVLADGRRGWVAKEYTEPRPPLGPGPLIAGAAVRTPAPGVRTLELTGRLTGARVVAVAAPQPGIAVLLPDPGALAAELPVADGGIGTLTVGSNGVFLSLDTSRGAPVWQVTEQGDGRLVVEVRPALQRVTHTFAGNTVIYRMDVTGYVQPRTAAGNKEVVVELPGAVVRATPAELPPFITVEERDRTVRVRVPSVLSYALKAGPNGSFELHLYPAGLRGRTIVVDPGHGGADPGAVNREVPVLEKDVTLAVALRLRTLLEQQGARVILTRAGDVAPLPPAPPAGMDRAHADLWYRADLSNRYGADLFVSIHANAGGTGGGTETYYSSQGLNAQRSRTLAELVQQELVRALARKDRGIRDEVFYVTTYAQAPAVLAELAFVNDPAEARLLIQAAFQEKAAAALLRAISRFFAGASPAP